VTAFRRDPTTGLLRFRQTERDGGFGTTSGFQWRGLAITPDGSQIYAANSGTSSIGRFENRSLCDPLPRMGCIAAGAASLTILDNANDERDKITARLR